MRENKYLELIERLEAIEKLSSVKIPIWLPEVSKNVQQKFQALRETIKINEKSWNYFQYCHSFSLFYFNIALLLYKHYGQHKTNLDIIRVFIEKCLSKLEGIRSSAREKEKTEHLFTQAVEFKRIIDIVYIQLEDKFNNSENIIEKAKVLVNLGKIDCENFNFYVEDLSRFKTHVLGILLMNYITDIEEILSLNENKEHFWKSNMCRYLARAYQLCGHDALCDNYLKRGEIQVTRAFEEMLVQNYEDVEKKVKGIIEKQVLEYHHDLKTTFKVIKSGYKYELSSLSIIFVEQNYVAFCITGFFKAINNTLEKIITANNKDMFMKLLSNLEKIKTMSDIDESFSTNSFYDLLIQHERYLSVQQRKDILKTYKKNIAIVIIPKISEAQKELDVLSSLLIFLRSVPNCRSIVTLLQIEDFCNKKISVVKFVENILNLKKPDIEQLKNLHYFTFLVKNEKKFLFMDKFISSLISYATIPKIEIEDNILTLKGSLIVLSEVLPTIKLYMTKDIKEIRFVCADVFFLDMSLVDDIWAGVNILLTAKTIHVQGKHTWKVTGQNAENYSENSLNGIKAGENGTDGKNGQHGLGGGNVYISCITITNSGDFTIIANGGNGGNGQAGGNGIKGANGSGIKSTEFKNLINPIDPDYKRTKDMAIPIYKSIDTVKNILHPEIQEDLFAEAIERLEEERRNTPDIPLPKIAKKVKIFDVHWTKAQFRLNVWRTGPCYFEGKDENSCQITYSYYPGWAPCQQQALAFYKGTDAESGGLGGTGGQPGAGGLPGQVDIKCTHQVDIVVEKNPGEPGQPGPNGSNAPPGENGWDMALLYVQGFFSSTWKIKGEYQNCKLDIARHSSNKSDDFVYSPYYHKELNDSEHYIQVKERSNSTFIKAREPNKNKQEQEKVIPTRTKAINKNVIQQYEENITNDIVDELQNQIRSLEELKEQALEEIVEKDEEKETEMTNFEVHRQAVFDDSSLNSSTKRLRKRQKVEQTHIKNMDVENVIANHLNINLWNNLKNIEINLNDLKKLHSVLLLNKYQFGDKFSKVYDLLLRKYKIATCQAIEQLKFPEVEVYFKPEPIENYLILDSSIQEVYVNGLGNLIEFFRPNPGKHLEKLQNYLKEYKYSQPDEKVKTWKTIGSILYPLKMFILEKSNGDSKFEAYSKNFFYNLDNLETKLERLIKCYLVAKEENEESGILIKIEDQKNKIIQNFQGGEEFDYVKEEFLDYISNVGMASSAVRELLACAFNVNIQIYVIDQYKEVRMCHNHNPTGQDTIYLVLLAGQFIQFRLNENYLHMVTERKKLSKNYSDILNYVNELVCIKDVDEFYQHFNKFNGYRVKDKIYMQYRNLQENEIINKICMFFPANDFCQIYPVLDKLSYRYSQNRNILKALLQRFETDGNHIDSVELIYICNSVMKAYIQKNTNLEIFEWIFSICKQSQWLHEVFYIELENYFKKSLKATSIFRYLKTVKQQDIIVLIDSKLKEESENVTLQCISSCLEVLSEITVDIDTIRYLPLSKWRYTLREQLVEYRLTCITQWKSNDQIQRALYYLSTLECNSGQNLIDLLLGILDIRKEEINAEICLDLFSLLHSQEWCLNNNLLDKLSNSPISSIKNNLLQAQQILDQERSLETLLNLIETNSHTSDEVKKILKSVKTSPFLNSTIDKPISNSKIEQWSKKFKADINGLSKKDLQKVIIKKSSEMLEMIAHAIYLRKGFNLRKTQKLAILLMLNQDNHTLSQISTGEGKSLIVVAVAIFKALCGQKVDIVTSSSVLAFRDATIHKDIFDLFNVGVDHNCSDKIDVRKDAYSGCPVIFGDLMNFQRDFLLNRFYSKNILGDRNFETLIVDEVDSMLLDKGNNTLYLSHEIPGLDKLESVYQFLWKRICMSIKKKYDNLEDILKKEVLFDLYGILSVEDIESSLKIVKSKALLIYNFLKDIKVLDEKDIVLKQITEKDAFNLPNHEKSVIESKSQLNKIRYLINRILDRKKEIRIPKCLYKFVEQHIDTWIKNGLLAIQMEEGNDYVVDIDHTQTKTDNSPNITIIDKGTGTDQSNSQWEEALHQFLQLKHGCKVAAQSLKAVFISNVSYFKMYNNLFGLTGTLGSQVERDLLKELYDVEFVNIPTAKPKRFLEQEALLCSTEVDWQFRIVNRAKELVLQRRSVLIICETIKEVNILSKAFQHSNIPDKKIYKREHEECLLAGGKEELDGGSIIIATNLAGRGTDIKITENLNKNGGLHVLLTYLPSNARIEQQAFGRAARSGCNGSGQLIIIGHGSFLDKRENRESEERQRIANIKLFFDQRIKKEEEFFKDFSDLYKKCNNSYWEKLTDKKVKEIASQRLLDRWAFWIDEYGSKLSDNNIDQIFDDFKKEIKSSFSSWNKWTDDPVQLVKIGLNYIENKSYKDAVKVFDKVIETEPYFCEAAHYYKALALVKQLDFEKRPFHGKDEDIYKKFLFELQEAEKLFEDHKDACMRASAFVQNLKQKMKNEIMVIDAYRVQQETLIKLYDFYIRTIQDIVGHAVYNSSFISQEVKADSSEAIYKSFLDNSVLRKSYIDKANPKDIEEICNSFGISRENLSEFLKSYEKKYIEEDKFLTDLKRNIRLPNLEECWDTLVQEKKLINEKRFVIIERSKISTIHEMGLNNLPKADIDIKSSQGKYVFMKQFVNSDTENIFIIEEKTLKQEISKEDYQILNKEKHLNFNRVAELSQNLSEPISLYDSLSLQNMCSEIENSEAENILDTLTKAKYLQKNSSNIYTLCKEYSEESLPEIVPYKPYIIQLLRMNFAYRIALQNIESELKNKVDYVYMNVINEPHSSLMWDLISKKIILPVKVEGHQRGNIEEQLERYGTNNEEKTSIKNHVKSVLKSLAGSLKSLEVPSFKLDTITEYLDQLQIAPLQELNTFMTNSLNYVIKAEEKKYTWAMIRATIFVMILGVLEIALGLILQLFFAGTLSHLGTWLISEGISDLQYSVSCWWTGYFNWDDYKQYKIQSMKMSLAFTAFSLGTTVSKFGERLALSGAKKSGQEICKMTGRKLIAEVGKKRIITEVSKQFILKVGEGLVKGLVNEGINHVVDSYLQNLCNQLSSTLIGDIETAVNRHPIRSTLNDCCKIFGKKECEAKINHFTEKSLSKPALTNTILSKALEITQSISTICQEAAKRGHAIPYAQFVTYLANVLQFAPFRNAINEITSSIERILDGVNQGLQRDLQEARQRGLKNKQYSETEVTDFTNKVINQWRTIIQERANQVFSEKIAKPVLREGSMIILKSCAQGVKNLYNTGRNKYHEHVFKNIKKNKNKQLEDTSLPEESKQKIILSYNKTLMELKAKVRDPKLYAEISAENGFMDAVGLKACAKVIDNLTTDKKPVKLITKCGDNLEFEYSTLGEGDTRESTIQLNDHHYTNTQGNDTSPPNEYDCYYHALAKDFPELNNITPEEFRKKICDEILNNPEIQNDIRKGKHAFTINRGVYGGMKRPLNEWTVNDLVDKIQNEDFLFSQSSARDSTRDFVTLKTLQEDIVREGFKKEYAINVVESKDGRYITLDHRRTLSLTTIDNPDFKFYVRIFKPNEILPSELQNQFKGKNKELPDITADKAVKIRSNRPKPYSVKEFKIRISNWEYFEQNHEFYRRLETVGFQFGRRNSVADNRRPG